MPRTAALILLALLPALPVAAADGPQHHRTYHFNADRSLREDAPTQAPPPDEVIRQVSVLQRMQVQLNQRLAALDYGQAYKARPADIAGIYPLTVTRFSCTCAHNDADQTCEGLASRLGNLKVITNVPFMRKDSTVVAIRSQGLVDEGTGRADTVDALFNRGIYWTGQLTGTAYEYNLMLLKSQKDQCVGNLEERIDLATKVGDIDADLYQCEAAFHLQMESNGSAGQPTLPQTLPAYCSPQDEKTVADCYGASAAFSAQEASNSTGHRQVGSRSSSASQPGYQLDGAGPDPGVQQTQHSLRLAVDGDHRMNEEPSRQAVARRAQATATVLAAGEIDLRRILRRHDPPARAGRRRAGRERCNHLATRHRGR